MTLNSLLRSASNDIATAHDLKSAIPGPWAIGDSHNDAYLGPPGEIAIMGAEGRYCVAFAAPCGNTGDLAPGVTQANAHLIAAAPDLYSALEAMTKAAVCLSAATVNNNKKLLESGDQQFREAYLLASAALSKARGETP